MDLNNDGAVLASYTYNFALSTINFETLLLNTKTNYTLFYGVVDLV